MPGRHALWLVPTEPMRVRLAALIEDLARAHATARFAPHVTLLAGLRVEDEDLRARARRLAREMRPLAATLGLVTSSPEHYRAVLVEVEAEGIEVAHARAGALFGQPPDPAFRAHLSLVYGDLPAAARASIVEKIGRRIDQPCTLDRLDVVRTEGTAEWWTRLDTIPLGPP